MPGNGNDTAATGADEWLGVGEVARRLGVTRQAVQGRIRRGTLETRLETRGNRQRLRVRLPQPLPQPEPATAAAEAAQSDAGSLLAEKDARIAELTEALAVERARAAWLMAELERHRWPGLLPWLRRWLMG